MQDPTAEPAAGGSAADAVTEAAADAVEKAIDTSAGDAKPEPAMADETPADEPGPQVTEPEDVPMVEELAEDAATAETEKPADTEKPAEPAKEEKPKIESFEDIRDELARSMVIQPALNKLDAAVTEVDKVMRTYFNGRAIAGTRLDLVPPRPDLKALAETLGMKHVVLGMMNGQEIQADPISLSFGVGTGMQRGAGLVQTLFSTQTSLFTNVRTVDDQAQISYISWKTEQREAYIPELAEVREEVISAIRMAEARKLAKTEADRLAAEFKKSDKPIKELIPEDRSSLFFQGLGPFSWMNSMGLGMRSFMGNVQELDRVGEAFMRQVFTSDRNEWGVAANMPETVYYVARPVEFSPSTDELHQRFAQVSQRMQTMSLAVEEAIKIRDGHYEALDKRTGFKWNEDALGRE